MKTAFLQIHTLTAYPAALLNRDDAGFAKRLPFGGATRIRVSSQCLKRHWRTHSGMHALSELEVPLSLRSRETFKRRIALPLIEEGYPTRLVVAFAQHLQLVITKGKSLGKGELGRLLQGEKEEDALLEELNMSQVIVLGQPEVEYLKEIIRQRLEKLRVLWEGTSSFGEEAVERIYQELELLQTGEIKKNLQGLRLASGLDAALFGRMATSDVLARADSAVHVAHAFTVHAEESESDYFTAVDDLVAEANDGPGSGLLSSQELTSGLFYGYVVVDVAQLISNLEGVKPEQWLEADRTLAAEVIHNLIHLIATVSPGAKRGSTAPYAYAHFMMLEWGAAQPRTLANAFHRPVPLNGEGVLLNTYRALGRYVEQMDRMHGKLTERRVAAIDLPGDVQDQLQVDAMASVPELADWASEKIRQGA